MAASNKYNLSTQLEDKRPRGGYGLAQGLSMSQGIPAKADARMAQPFGQVTHRHRKSFAHYEPTSAHSCPLWPWQAALLICLCVACRLPSLSASNSSRGQQQHGQLLPIRSGLYPQLWRPLLPHPRKPSVHCSTPSCSLVTAQHNRRSRPWTWTEPDLAGLALGCPAVGPPASKVNQASTLLPVSGLC